MTRLLPPLSLMLLLCSWSLNGLSAAQLNVAEVQSLTTAAQEFILKDVQEDGALYPGDRFRLGVTAVILTAVTDGPNALGLDDQRVANALKYLKSYQQPDGGIYNPKQGVGNYVTSLTLIAMSNVGDKDADVIKKAQDYLLGLQNTEEDSIFKGGIGYGSAGPGHEDLNNTTYAITALRKSGVPADHPAMKSAMEFLNRCQNHSATNPVETSGNDGGAFYSPDVSKVRSFGDEEDRKIETEEQAAGKLKSYGTMTYNLINSFIYLQVKQDDPRMRAALNWALEHYQFEKNPGMHVKQEKQGLYYYYMMLAKTFSRMGKDQLTLPDGKVVDWRVDLLAALKKRTQEVQLDNGETGLHWVNKEDRWMEADPFLVTAYVLSCLNYISESVE